MKVFKTKFPENITSTKINHITTFEFNFLKDMAGYVNNTRYTDETNLS